ncbi:hypothetical protein A0H81_08936 [Grifola frondosa]|uniref:Uncharacterized protein n=1 Tax=Grifola frondosa TaxID=5627 RepID=A0A1C7M8K9_GRIFR|nr:hypothetical protein A0H81_08936 [Grifola frondosa]
MRTACPSVMFLGLRIAVRPYIFSLTTTPRRRKSRLTRESNPPLIAYSRPMPPSIASDDDTCSDSLVSFRFYGLSPGP